MQAPGAQNRPAPTAAPVRSPVAQRPNQPLPSPPRNPVPQQPGGGAPQPIPPGGGAPQPGPPGGGAPQPGPPGGAPQPPQPNPPGGQVPILPPRPPIVGPNDPINKPNARPTTRPPRVGLTGIPDARCPAQQNPRNPVHLPHATNCERFYKCDHGMAFEYQCPVGQHWNVARNYCDFPNMANCGGHGNFPMPPNSDIPAWSPPNNWNPAPMPPQNNVPIFQNPILIPMAPGL